MADREESVFLSPKLRAKESHVFFKMDYSKFP